MRPTFALATIAAHGKSGTPRAPVATGRAMDMSKHLENCAILLAGLALAATAAPKPATAAELAPGGCKDEAGVAQVLREHYTKRAVRIPMRDGVRLYTHIYTPRDTKVPWPILLTRTPYSIGPYGVDNLPDTSDSHGLRRLAPAPALVCHGMILVEQDVRGRVMSEGKFVDVRPVVAHTSAKDIGRKESRNVRAPRGSAPTREDPSPTPPKTRRRALRRLATQRPRA
ncbi:MAG: hypothetical protein HY902_20560, partial [Deltaproteobacteria bacterium]|nr:hypothetical protein [Deltaproteobacteria bacterium]